MLFPYCVVFVVILSTLFVASCSRHQEEHNTLYYGLTLAPTGIDPHLNASNELGIPLSSVYDTLVFLNPETGVFVPGLAERWTISDDGMTYTFYLREDVIFHDGSQFNAAAVKATIDYIVNPDNHSQRSHFMLGPLSEVEVIDDFTITFHLDAPYAPLLDTLSQVYVGIASPEALETWGAELYQFHQVGTGPYVFVEYIPNDHLTLRKNPDYNWAPEIYRSSRAEIEEIVFRFYEDVATRALALENREVDIMSEVPYRDAIRLASSSNFELHQVPIPGQPLQFMFNTQNRPTDDVRVRQALVVGVDRSSIVQTIYGEYSPVANSVLASNTTGYSNEFDGLEYDPERAQTLLHQAGWIKSDGGGGRFKDGVPLELHIVVPNWGSNPDVGQLVEYYWGTLGANVHLEVVPGFGILKEKQTEWNYNAIGFNSFGSDPDLLRSFYTSNSSYNWMGYQDEELDNLLQQGVEAYSMNTDREELYAQVAEKVMNSWLVLPIRDYVNLVVTNDRVRGLHFSAQGWFPFLIDLKMTQ